MPRFHKNSENYINLMEELFPELPNLEIFYRCFDIVKLLDKLKVPASVNELSYELNLSDQRIRIKLRDLVKTGICSMENVKKTNEIYSRNYYKLLINSEIIKRFEKYIFCHRCTKVFGKFGGIIFVNRAIPDGIKVFCSIRCRNLWCFECQ